MVTKSPEVRTQTKYNRMREYFYGVRSNLYPYNIDIRFSDFKIFKIGAPMMSSDLLPAGMNHEENYTKIFKVTPCKLFIITINYN